MNVSGTKLQLTQLTMTNFGNTFLEFLKLKGLSLHKEEKFVVPHLKIIGRQNFRFISKAKKFEFGLKLKSIAVQP